MIILYRRIGDHESAALEEQLRELVLAHRVIQLAGEAALPDGSIPTAWPVLELGHQRYEGLHAVQAFLEELAHEVLLNRQFQSDACYLDPDDPSHCL